MKKIILLLALVAFTQLQAQTSSEKASAMTCDCVHKIDSKRTTEAKREIAYQCMQSAMLQHWDGLLVQYKITEKDMQQAALQISEKFGEDLVRLCPDILPYLMSAGEGNDINPDTLKLDTKVCPTFKSGEYIAVKTFMNNKNIPTQDKTAYTSVSGNIVTDYSNNGKTITKWTIQYISDCEWEQTLVSTTDENMQKMIKPGDKIVMKAIGSTGKTLWLSSEMFGMKFITQIQKK